MKLDLEAVEELEDGWDTMQSDKENAIVVTKLYAIKLGTQVLNSLGDSTPYPDNNK